jgi:membrane protein YdbS with pleckstrin-like domain
MQYHNHQNNPNKESWRDILREKLFEGKTAYAKIFDILMLILIIVSIITIILETIPFIFDNYSNFFWRFEIFFTLIFTIEYFLRIITAKKYSKFIFSFEGIIDFLTILPLYIILIFGGNHLIGLVRVLKLFRIIPRIISLSKDLSNTMHFVTHINEQLANNEKIIMYFKRSRKRFILIYISILILIFLSLSEIFFDFLTNNIFNSIIINILSYILFIFAIFLFIKYELKTFYERYAITNHRVIRSIGIIHEDFKGTTYRFIADVFLYQSFIDKILGIGKIIIKTTGEDKTGNIELVAVSDYLKIKNIIHNYIISSHHNNR